MKRLIILVLLFSFCILNASENKILKQTDVENLIEQCNNSNYVSCNRLGLLYKRGKKVEKNIDRAIHFYKKSCEGSQARSCGSLGTIYNYGNETNKDLELSFKYYKKACDLGDLFYCGDIGTFYYEGLYVEKDTQKGIKFWDISCKDDYFDYCTMLGVHHIEKKNNKKAKEYFTKSCEAGIGLACLIIKKAKL
jgi:TPR repeat protein